MNKRIAILGATSHIAKNLITGWAGTNQLALFARSTDKAELFLIAQGLSAEVLSLDEFGDNGDAYDSIINCVGYGTPEKVRAGGGDIFTLTERYDNRLRDYLHSHPSTVCVCFSSGAIYGTDHSEPIRDDAEFRIRLDSIGVADAYRIAKLNSEAKHRSWTGLSVIDLRLFSFFSRHIDTTSSYLVSDMVRAIKSGEEFATGTGDVVRDYIHPIDLRTLVGICAEARGVNTAIDVFSAASATKSEIIDAFRENFGLKVRYLDSTVHNSPTGAKGCYASASLRATNILGFSPAYFSMDALLEEARELLR